MVVEVDIAQLGAGPPQRVWPADDWVDEVPEWLLVAPPDEWAGRPADPLEGLVADLAVVDRAMARVLRQLAHATPREGLSVRRQVALRAGATGIDVGFLDRAVQTLAAMPRTQQAFDDGALSWSQVRGIVGEARRLSVAQRGVLDEALAATIAQGRARGEPDRVVEVAGDLAGRLDVAGQERLERDQERGQHFGMQLDFTGWGLPFGALGPEITAHLAEALDALAEAPVAADAPPVTDDDGRVLPHAARPATSRAAQWAEALGRMAALALGRTTGAPAEETDEETDEAGPSGAATAGQTVRRARPRVPVIAPLADLLDHAEGDDAEAVGSVTARLLLRRGTGRRRISRALTRALADDADLVAIFTDAHGMPAAIGDCYSPITQAMRRAVAARDQGCRAPGCSAPIEHCSHRMFVPPDWSFG